MGDRGDVQQQVGGASEGGVDRHGVLERRFGQDLPNGHSFGVQPHQRPGRPFCHIGPDKLTRRRQRAVGQGKAEGFAHDLRSGRRTEELAAPARRRAGPAAHVRRVFQRNLTVGVPGADGLDLAGVFTLLGRQRNAARHQHAGQVVGRRQRDHHGGQPLVARRHADHAAARRQRPDQAPEDYGRVVAVRQAVHHARRALGAPVTGIGAVAAEGYAAQGRELLGGRLHEQADLPVARVVPQGHGRSVGCADPSLGAEDQVFPAIQRPWTPTHAHVLGQAEEVAARTFPQHVSGQRQAAFRARCTGLYIVYAGVGLADDGLEGEQGRCFHDGDAPFPIRPVVHEAYQLSGVSAGGTSSK